MSDTTVDTRQVSIHFDHADFEQGVSQTLASLNKLNQAVENSGNTSSDGFRNLSNQLEKVDYQVKNNVVPALDTMTSKFSFFGTMADQITRNLATNIQNTFSRATGAIFQVNGGMKEYELKMGSIQTIMNGTGESLDRVNEKLNELNTYSDRTIYSFKDMTENIGKFTNQGVKDLDKAVAAIKGIANEAALSGATSAQASHAMYNFAQALSTGYVGLMDWKSIENAMMATSGFRETLLETGVALGTVNRQGAKFITTTTNAQGKVSDLFDAEQGFRDSLNHRWITTDVLTQALELYATDVRELTDAEKAEYEAKLKSKGFTDEQIKNFEELGIKAANAATEIKTFSMLVDTAMEAIGSGWAQTFEIIFGDFEEAKALWTGINNEILDPMISKFSDIRNNMLRFWKDNGGRTATLQSFVNVLNAIDSVLRPIGEAFNDIFGEIDGSALVYFSNALQRFTYSLIGTNEQMDAIRDKARVVFAIAKCLLELLIEYRHPIVFIWSLTRAFSALNFILSRPLGLRTFVGLFKTLLFLASAFHAIKPYIPWEKLQNVLDKIDLKKVENGLRMIAALLVATVGPAIEKLVNKIGNSKIFNAFINFLKRMRTELKNVISGVYDVQTAIEAIQAAFDDLFKEISLSGNGFLAKFTNLFTRSKSDVKSMSSSIQTMVKPVGNSVGLLDKVQTKVENIAGSFSMTAYAAESTEKPIYYVGEGMKTVAQAAAEGKKEVEDVSKSAKEVEKPMQKWVDLITQWASKLESSIPSIKPVTDYIKEIASNLGEINPVAQNVLNVITTIASKINWAMLIAFGVIVFYIKALRRIGDSVTSVGTAVDLLGGHFDNLFGIFGGITSNIKNLTDNIGSTFLALTNYINALQKELGAQNFKNTAFGVLALAGAFAILATAMYFLDSDILQNAAIGLVALAGAVMIINAAMAGLSKLVDPVGLAALAGELVVVTVLLGVMALSLLAIGGVIAGLAKITGSVNNALMAMVKVLGVLAVILTAGFVALWIFTGLVAGIGAMWQPVLQGAGVIAAMSAAILLFDHAILTTVTTVAKVAPAILAFVAGIVGIVTAIGAAIVGFVKLVGDFGVIGNVLASIAVGVIAFAGIIAALKITALAMIAISFDLMLAGVMLGVGVLTFAGGIGTLALSISMLVLAMGQVGLAIFAFLSGVKAILNGLAESFNSLTTFQEKIGWILLHFNTITVAVVAIIGIAAAFGAVVKWIKSLVDGLGRDLLFVAGAILVISYALRAWAAIPMDVILQATLSLCGTLLAIAFALRVLNGVGIGKVAAAVMSLVIAMYMLTPLAALYGLAFPILGKGMIIIAGGMLAIAGACKLMEKVDAGRILAVSLSMVGAIGAITYMATLLGATFKENEKGMTEAVASIFGLMLVFAMTIAVIGAAVDNMKNIGQFAGVVGIFTLVCFGIVVALSALAELQADAVLKSAFALATAMGAFSGAIILLSIASNILKPEATFALIGLMIAFAGASFILAAGLAQLQGMEWQEIAAFVGLFGLTIVGLTVALGAFGPALTAASLGLAAVALVIMAAGAAAYVAGAGFKMMAEGVNIIFQAITAFIPVFLQFLSSMADLAGRSQDIITISKSIGVFGKNLMILAAGMALAGLSGIPFAAGLISVSLAVGAFSLALGLASFAIIAFATAVKVGFEAVSGVVDEAVSWGADLVHNFVEGMLGGIQDIADAARTVATTIWNYLHQSTAEMGPLADTDLWGGHLIGNIAGGMLENLPKLETVTKVVGGTIAEGVKSSATDGTGTSIVSKICSDIMAGKGLGEIAGNVLGEGIGNGALSSVSPYIEQIKGLFTSATDSVESDILKRAKAKVAKGQYDKLTSEEHQALRDDKKNPKDKNSQFSIDDFMKKLGLDGEGKSIKDEVEDAIGGIGDIDTDATKSGKGKSSKTSDAELKKQAEAQKIHNKYVKLSNDLATEYTKTYGDLMTAMGDTNPQATATAAIEKLKDYMYQASITADMTEDELKEAAQNVEKQFVETYENIKKKTAEVFDGFKEFDNGLTSVTPAKTILKNIEDQVNGVEDMEGLWQTLALRSGTDMDYLSELMEGGAEKLPVLRSLASMTSDEYSKYMSSIADRKTISERAANTAMVAKAFMLQRDEIVKTAKTQRAYKSAGKKMIDAWNEAYNSGAEHADLMCNSIAKNFEELAKQNGLTFEQLRDQITGTTLTTEEELEKQINAYTNLSSTVEKWKSTYMKSYDDVKNGLKGLSTDLSDIDLSYDEKKSGKHLYNNLYKRNKALGEWGRMLNDLASRGLDEKFLANYAAQGLDSYKEVKGLSQLSDERLHQMNGMMQSIEQQSEAIAKKYGASIANKMVEGMDSSLVDAFKKYAITDKIDMEGLAKEVGVNLKYIGNQFSLSLADGIKQGIGDVKNAVTTLTNTIITATQQQLNKVGNVDINARPIVYNDDGSYSTTETTFQQKWVGDENTGHYRIGHFATIRNNGTRLTDSELDAYIEKVLGADDPFGVDAQMDNLLYMVAEKISSGEYITDRNIDQAFAEAKIWDENMHNLQDSMYQYQAQQMRNLTAAQNGIKTLGEMRQISPIMTTPYVVPIETNKGNVGIIDAIKANQYDDTKLVTEVAGLRQDVNTLNDKMGNLQVVMDTGPLVGAIAPKMDRELGNIYRRNNR